MQLWYRPIHFYEQIKNCWFLTFCTKKWERRGSGIVFSSSSFANERGKFWNSLFRPAYDPEKRIWNFGSTLFCPNYSSGKKVMKIISLSRKLRRSRKRRTWEIYMGGNGLLKVSFIIVMDPRWLPKNKCSQAAGGVNLLHVGMLVDTRTHTLPTARV